MSTNMKATVAGQLLDIKAVFLQPENPFTWASGIISPIYCDNRLTLSYPETRNIIEDGLADLVKANFPEAEMLMGTATAGIAHAAIAADRLAMPMGYVRSGSKSHGRQNQIEGRVEAGMKVVVVEDLLSTGKSSIEAVKALQEAGCDVLGVIAIFSYEMTALKDNFAELGLPYVSLSDYDALLEVAQERGIIQPEQLDALNAWKQDPYGNHFA